MKPSTTPFERVHIAKIPYHYKWSKWQKWV